METILKRRPLFVYVIIISAIVSTILLLFANQGNSSVNNGLVDNEGTQKTEDVIKPKLHMSDIDHWVTSQSYFKKLCDRDRYILNQNRNLE